MVDQANHFILFQPIYQVAARNSLAKVPVTAAGWLMDMSGVTPKA
jgi:peptide/nickel transport system substrate-binding protein